MLDENGEIISDEASVYSISTVTDKATNLNTNTDKETESFWSGWLFKLLISLILLIILFILGKNIYKKIMHKRHSDRILGHH
jgi:flagellar biogenesis protein FliO